MSSEHIPAAQYEAVAALRTSVHLPIRLADGREVSARAFSFKGLSDGKEHIALLFGNPAKTPLVRVHSECLTGDALGSMRCDCGPQLQESLQVLHEEGGYLLYLRQEGRGIGLYRKLEAYALQETGQDTFEANIALGHSADEREYEAAAQMLKALGAKRITLISNNPDKRSQLEEHGIEVVAVRNTGVHVTAHNLLYLKAKVQKTGHRIQLQDTLRN